jgi:hypothetical protein
VNEIWESSGRAWLSFSTVVASWGARTFVAMRGSAAKLLFV